MRKGILLFVIVTIIVGSLFFLKTATLRRTAANHFPRKQIESPTLSGALLSSLKTKAVAAKAFAAENNMNQQICFLIDMNIASGSNRFFVYDLQRDSVRNAAPVTHGRCNQEWLEGRKYGNTVGCGCTSLGRYKIGKKYHGRFGLAFKLHGLDKTNSNAFERFVVLHGHECVPSTAVEEDICQSDGCPTVSPSFLSYLQPIISRSPRPVLLWIYDSSESVQ